MPANNMSEFMCNKKHHGKRDQETGGPLALRVSRSCGTGIGDKRAHVYLCIIARAMKPPVAILLRGITNPREELGQAEKTMNKVLNENQCTVVNRDDVPATRQRSCNRVERTVVVDSAQNLGNPFRCSDLSDELIADLTRDALHHREQ